MSKGKVLVVGSNATRIEIQGGGTGPTGQYLNETVVPVMALVEEGYEIVLATPDGTKPHIDPVSDVAQHFGGDEAAYKRGRAFFDDDPAMNNVRTLRSVINDGLDGYAGVFVPGGQAPVVDLMQDADLGEILRHFHVHGKPTAFLCHGPIASLAALPKAKEYRAALIAGDVSKVSELAKGWQYAGYKMTCSLPVRRNRSKNRSFTASSISTCPMHCAWRAATSPRIRSTSPPMSSRTAS
jgi:putative intracellular protease/amidase